MITINADKLDPVVRDVGRLAGLLSITGNQVTVDSTWFNDPYGQLKNALTDPEQSQALLDLLGDLFSSDSADVLGLPGPNANETWYPIKDGDDKPTGLYLVARKDTNLFHIGVGVRWSTSADPITARVWAHVPLLAVGAGGANFSMGQAGSPVQLAIEIAHKNGFGNDQLHFDGIKLAGSILFTGAAPEISFVFVKLKLPNGQQAADRTLANLASIAPREWVEMALAILSTQLGGGTPSPDLVLVRDHLLPILGITGTPGIRWEEMPQRGAAVLRDWMAALLNDANAARAWLGHWGALLGTGTGKTPLALAGTGTRSDPWRVGVTLGPQRVVVSVTLAMQTAGSGTRSLFPGVLIGSSDLTLVQTLRLALEGAIELARIELAASPVIDPVPAFDVRARLFDTSGTLADYTFPTGHALAPLQRFRLKELRAGFGLDPVQRRPVPQLQLIGVSCGRGTWEVLDFSSAQAALDGFANVANAFIQDQLQTVLGTAAGVDHPGRHVAALLGLVPSTAAGAPSAWPVDTVLSTQRVTTFLGDPLGTVACYHVACLETLNNGAPLWRFLLSDLAALLKHASVPVPAITGTGGPVDPWRVTVYDDVAGRGTVVAWAAHESTSGGPTLAVALDLDPPRIPLGTTGINLTLRQRTHVLELDLPPMNACPGPVRATWLPEVHLTATVAGSGPIEMPSVAGLQLQADSLQLGGVWNQRTGFAWTAAVENPKAQWTGSLAGSLTLPDLKFGGLFDGSWSFSELDFGLGLSLDGIDELGSFLRFAIGRWLLEHGGAPGFGFAGLMGLLPNPGDLELPDLPDWSVGPFALPFDWPAFQPADWPDFFANPWPDIRVHIGRLLGEPRWAWPALQWLGASLHAALPDLSLPDLGWQRINIGGNNTEIAFPTLPFSMSGAGTYANPWAITINDPVARGVEVLVWLDPDGPPSGDAVDVAAALAPQGIAALSDLLADTSADFSRLLEVAEALSAVDGTLKNALRAVDRPRLAQALTILAAYLDASDGVVLVASQQPTGSGWNAPVAPTALPEAHHGAQLSNDAVATAIKNKIDEWSGATPLPVILIGAPWESSRAPGGVWATVLAKMGIANAAHVDFFQLGVDPVQVSLAGLTQGTRVCTVDLAVLNTAPAAPAGNRALPVDGPPDGASQSAQVSRLVDRLRELNASKRVIIVAHSTSGLAARAAITRDGNSTRVRGVITIGTPHLGSIPAWIADASVSQALAFLGRFEQLALENQQIRAAVEQLLKFVNGEWTDKHGSEPLGFPSHCFQPAGPVALPAGVNGHAVATRLPSLTLRGQIAAWLTSRTAQLRTTLGQRAAVTHAGFGVRLLPPPATISGVQVSTTARVDAARATIRRDPADSSAYPALPRLELLSTITRPGGWLVGGPGANPRVRWMELGAVVTAQQQVIPIVRLHDGHVDGVDAALAELRQLAGGLEASALVRPLLDAVMRTLTRESETVPAFDDLCELLKQIDLAISVGTGYGIQPDAFNALLADAAEYFRTRLGAIVGDTGKREALFAALRKVFAFTAEGPATLFGAQAGDSPALGCIRDLLAALGLVGPAAEGYALRPNEWLQLVRAPASDIRARFEALVGDEPKRSALINAIRQRLSLNSSTTASPESAFGPLKFKATSTGGVSLCVSPADGVLIGSALRLYGCARLDLNARSISIDLNAAPAGLSVAAGVVYSLSVPAAGTGVQQRWAVQLDWPEEEFPASYERLEIYPVPPDFGSRLGRMLPRFLLSIVTDTLVETVVLPRVPAVGPLLEVLGLASRSTATAPWRMRAIDGLLVDPVRWMLSPKVLGTAAGDLDPAKLVAVATRLATAFGLGNVPGQFALPYGMRVQVGQAASAVISIETNPALVLPGGGSLDLTFTLTIPTVGSVGVGGAAELRYPLPPIPAIPGMWNSVVVSLGQTNGAFTVTLGTDTLQVQLLPFQGWSSVLLGLGGNARRLLPTMVEASVVALENRATLPGLSQLTPLLNSMRLAAQVLELDSLQGLDAMLTNPVAWLQRRFSSVNAPASATAIFNLLDGRVPDVSRSAGLITYRPAGGPVTIKIGRDTQIGLTVGLNQFSAGPVVITLTGSVGISDSANPPAQFIADVDITVAPAIIRVGGVSLEPRLHFGCSGSVGASPQLAFYLYPLGDKPGSPDFRLDILPTFSFSCEGDPNFETCLLEFARRILLPAAVELLLDTPAVTTWLKAPLITGRALTAGQIGVSANVLAAAGAGFDLQPVSQFTDPKQFVSNVLGAALDGLATAFSNDPLVAFGGGGIYIGRRTVTGGAQYGVRLKVPGVTVSEDPEIVLQPAADAAWIKRAHSAYDASPAPDPGIVAYVLKRTTSNAFDFLPGLEIVSAGVEVSGKGTTPLIDVSGFRIGGIGAKAYVSVDFPGWPNNQAATVTAGGALALKEIGIPIGTAGGNPVAKNLLSPGPGDKQAINPTFDVEASYINRFDLRFGSEKGDEVWIPIQRKFGPIHIGQIGLRWEQDIKGTPAVGDRGFTMLVDGGVVLSGLAVGVDDLSVTIPIATAGDLGTWRLGLKGLAVGYEGSSVKLAAGLIQVGDGIRNQDGTIPNPIRYDGLVLVEVAGKTFMALGSYMQDPYTSMFVFVLLPIALGGPPYFFILGFAGGFGYNRDLITPPIEQVHTFPFVAGAMNPTAIASDPMGALIALGDRVPPKKGAYWLAAGIKFSSFELVHSFAMVYVLLNEGFEIGLLGLAQMKLPEGKPLVSIELALRVRLSTREGVFSLEAQLTNNSWLLSKECRLTGGFAFYIWFGGEHRGDFVITLGGYFKSFTKPAHYPSVPRLGFAWYFSSEITIKGESYFALTPSCVMAGGLLEASYQSGALKAWFKAWADFLIAWEPFSYYISVGVTIGASYRIRVNVLVGTIEKTLKVEVSASVEVWGPPLAGKAHIEWFVISFDVEFGAREARPPKVPISWDAFRERFLPEENSRLFFGSVEQGLVDAKVRKDGNKTVVEAGAPWRVGPEFVLVTETSIASNFIDIPTLPPYASGFAVDVAPMRATGLASRHVASVVRVSGTQETPVAAQLRRENVRAQFPAAMWDYVEPEKADSRTVPALSGIRFIAKVTPVGATGALALFKIFTPPNPVLTPLPFSRELLERGPRWRRPAAALGRTAGSVAHGATIEEARTILGGQAWFAHRSEMHERLSRLGLRLPPAARAPFTSAYLSRMRTAPPQVVSLRDGLGAAPVHAPRTPQSRRPKAVPEAAPPPRDTQPSIRAVLHGRPSATRATPPAVRTTVKTLARASMPRVPIAEAVRQAGLGGGVRRVAGPGTPRATTLSVGGRVFINDRFATVGERDQFTTLQRGARINRSPQIRSRAGRTLQNRGAMVQAGATIVWDLPARLDRDPALTMVVDSDQVIRIASFDRAGVLLADVDRVGGAQYQLPRSATRVAVSGLGRATAIGGVAKGGSVLLSHAADRLALVGWQLDSQLVQVGPTALLARGAVVSTAAPLDTRMGGHTVFEAIVMAADALAGQPGVETFLPTAVTTVGILLEQRDAAGDATAADSVRVSARGATLSARPVMVAGGSRAFVLYDVTAPEAGAAFIAVAVAHGPAWRVSGVVGMPYTADHWAATLAVESFGTLVEDGPLTPDGLSRVAFVDTPSRAATARRTKAVARKRR